MSLTTIPRPRREAFPKSEAWLLVIVVFTVPSSDTTMFPKSPGCPWLLQKKQKNLLVDIKTFMSIQTFFLLKFPYNFEIDLIKSRPTNMV